MSRLRIMRGSLNKIHNAVARYPLAVVFLFTAAVLVSYSIQSGKDYIIEILSCIFGVFFSLSLQAVFERFFYKISIRLAFIGCSSAFTLGYYLIIKSVSEFSEEIGIRTLLGAAALFSAYLWIPTIRSQVTFNESFFIAFKAFFQSLLFSLVIFGGSSFIIAALDLLIIPLRSTAYLHVANLSFLFFAPVFFLSLIPVFPGEKDHKEEFDRIAEKNELIKNAAGCPKFLEVLLSNVVVPLLSAFTIILLLYIVINIQGDFWTSRLLEPMLISYATAVILVYLLTSRMENKFSIWFRRVLPRVFVPMMAFQIASSLLSLKETGITHTRYFIIVFGIYAILAGIVMCFIPIKKNGILAVMLILFSLICIVPPVDAFSVSRISQENRLKHVLIKNAMLRNNQILKQEAIPDEDKEKIILSVEYLERMHYTDKIAWFPKDFSFYEDFYNTFGFDRYEQESSQSRFIYVSLKSDALIDIQGYDALVHVFLNTDDNRETKICEIEQSGRNYTLNKVKEGDTFDFILVQANQEVIRWNVQEIFSRYRGYTEEKYELSNEEASFTVENNEAKLTFVIREANINFLKNESNYFINLDILILIK
ncbi:hypothetical protein [Sinanaerobacter sp. ZZT-01]|uniref:hypothetical protein n=1 Tax=Sinanaerobacter sp. ZZT-01 TaxID=3111540 RepID=UPI002D76C1D3|nr:hypothetical protein [Sinanaerobacter sp. ZZT-01]WRR93631.1 hypothetical protein U5921_00465 [Sinanaerobacter sp. ZZT-01]